MKNVIRTLSFFGTWMGEALRQPALLLTLVAGPFFILLTFGFGLAPFDEDPRAALVVPPDAGSEVREVLRRSEIGELEPDREAAVRRLREGEVDIVLVVPPGTVEDLQAGRQSRIEVITNSTDPVRENFAQAYVMQKVSVLNREMLKQALVRLQEELRAVNVTPQLAARFEWALARSPDVVTEPFGVEFLNVAPVKPSGVASYTPAVLALLLQHLAVTLGALSMTRLRMLGIMDLLRVSPVRPVEVVLGHYLTYGLVCAVSGAALLALMVYGLGMPVLGSYTQFLGVLLVLVFTGLGIGFFLTMLSSTEQQAAQLVMLLLLASILFTGFMFSLDRIAWPVRALSYVLPATYAIRSLEDVMLRGWLRSPGDLALLGGAAVLFLAATVLLLRREFRPA